MNLRPARIATAVGFGLAITLLFPNYAPGAPNDDLQQKAKDLESQIEANGAKVSALDEQANAIQIKLDDANAKIADADARTQAAEQETDHLRSMINERAASIYKVGGTSGPFDAINAKDANDITARSKYGDVAASHDDSLINQLAASKQDLAAQKDAAEKARQDAQAQKDALDNTKAQFDAAAAQEQSLLGQVKGQLADLVKQEQATRAAAAATAKPKSSSTGGGSSWSGPVPSASGGAGAAVAFAQAQVGKPYCYAGTGPDCFDCSGLTMRAWQAGGVSMPHSSGAQGSMFPHVPLDQLQPGDLITTTDTGWSEHVGIWVGGGYIHATHTGDFVRFVGGAGTVADAVRPG